MVLLKKEMVTAANYKLGRVYSAVPCMEDGLVRKVVVGYHTHQQAPLRFTERLVNKLVLVVPVEEQEHPEEAGRLELPPGACIDSLSQVYLPQMPWGSRRRKLPRKRAKLLRYQLPGWSPPPLF